MGENCVSLPNAMEQMQELDQRLKKLEEQDEKQKSIENSGESDGHQRLLEIRARVCLETVLLKIQCEKRKGTLVKLLLELDKLNLDVVSASVMPFGALILDITITAQVEKEFIGSMKDVETSLRNCLSSDS